MIASYNLTKPIILWYIGRQKSFTTQSKLLVSATDLNHPILHSHDYTEALLK